MELHPDDARRLGVADGDRVRVVSPRGQVEAKAKLTDWSLAGQVAVSGHFRETPVHRLTSGTLDAVGKGPALQTTHVRVERVGERP